MVTKCSKCGSNINFNEKSGNGFCSNCGTVIIYTKPNRKKENKMIEVKKLTATEKADNACKEIIKRILEHPSKDLEPRPSYIDKYEDCKDYEISISPFEKVHKKLVRLNDKDNNEIDLTNLRDFEIDKEKNKINVTLKFPAHTYSINHVMQTFDIAAGEFPLLSLRPIAIKKAIGEILWIYQDQTSDLKILRDKYGVTWWDQWDIGDGTIGECYGKTVKKHRLIDTLLDDIIKNPDGRRHILDLNQVDDFKMPHGLVPCALYSQYLVRHEEDGDYLDGFMLLRSSDYLTAGSINQCQYVALLMMIARHTGYKVGKFTNVIVNCQIYDRHIENAKIMLERKSIPANPKLILNPNKKNFYDITLDDFKVVDYPRKEIEATNPQLKFDLGV